VPVVRDFVPTALATAKLTFSVATFNMDVGWFVLFIGVEVEPVGAYAEDGGHSVSFQIAA
jgi:hypothetical protein